MIPEISILDALLGCVELAGIAMFTVVVAGLVPLAIISHIERYLTKKVSK